MAHTIRHGERGFTYFAAIFILAVLSIMTLKVSELWRTTEQRERELQLLFVGEQYRSAIQMYYQLSPGTTKQYPSQLSDLLLDTRATQTLRPLRQLFFDPITNSQTWGLVQAPDGGIMGVYSLSTAVPIKQQGFLGVEANFAAAKQYQGWQFTVAPS